jgi:hypothetical protein
MLSLFFYAILSIWIHIIFTNLAVILDLMRTKNPELNTERRLLAPKMVRNTNNGINRLSKFSNNTIYRSINREPTSKSRRT